MSEVTVTAVQAVLGLAEGDTVTIERTKRIAAHIDAGHLREHKPTPAPAAAAVTVTEPDDAPTAPPAKSTRGKS